MNDRYSNMERVMLILLTMTTALFVVFLVASSTAINWLKILSAIVSIIVSFLCLVYLYLTKELLRRRSLWISTAFSAIIVCILFSVILQFPCPKP